MLYVFSVQLEKGMNRSPVALVTVKSVNQKIHAKILKVTNSRRREDGRTGEQNKRPNSYIQKYHSHLENILF